MAHHRRVVILGTSLLMLLMLLGCSRALAQEIVVSGQVRPRWESRDAPDVEADGDGFVSMRTRIGVSATLSPVTRAFAQIQDVRLWGSELNTLNDASADMLDLHQAWLEIGRADATNLRVGRQEARYGAERLIGAVDWVQQGRAFDGLRVTHPLDGARVDGFWFQVADQTSGVHADDAMLTGAYATLPFLRDTHSAEAFALWNTDLDTDQQTLGGRLLGRHGIVALRFEGAAQLGERAGMDVSAHLLSGEVGIDVIDGVTVSAMYDRLSGDDDPLDDEVRVFDTLFATNHKFYGYADLFLNIPAHTGGRGLQDMALKSAWRPIQPLTLTLDLHRFDAAADDGMDDGHFADEADLVASWRFSPTLGLSAGLFWVDPAAGLGEIGRPTDELLVTYLAVDATF